MKTSNIHIFMLLVLTIVCGTDAFGQSSSAPKTAGLVQKKWASVDKINPGDNFDLILETYLEGSSVVKRDNYPIDLCLSVSQAESMLDPMYSFDRVGYNNISSKTDLSGLDTSKPDFYYCAVETSSFLNSISDRWGKTYYGVRYSDGKWQYQNRVGTIMKWHDFGSNKLEVYISKNGLLQDAIGVVHDLLLQDCNATGVKHAISIAGYGPSGFSNKQILLPTVVTNTTAVNNAIKSLAPANSVIGSGSHDDQSLKVINENYTAPTGNGTYTRVVIHLCDGAPRTTGDLIGAFYNAAAKDAFGQTDIMKNKGIKVYSLGLFDAYTQAQGVTTMTKVSEYLSRLSSNYKSGQSCSGLYGTSFSGDIDNTAGGRYFMLATSAAELNSVLKGFAEEAVEGGSAMSLDATTVAKDVLSSDFKLPDGLTASDIKVYTSNCTGLAADGKTRVFEDNAYNPGSYDKVNHTMTGWTTAAGVTVNISKNSSNLDVVDVDGFSYSDHWCGPVVTYVDGVKQSSGMHSGGQKLIIVIPVTAGPDVNGDSQTNDPSSGIYKAGESEPLDNYPVPNVISPIYLTITQKGLASGETAIYKVTGSGSASPYRIILIGNGDAAGVSKQIKCYPDTYSITCESDWSWKYTNSADISGEAVSKSKTFPFTMTPKSVSTQNAEAQKKNDLK